MEYGDRGEIRTYQSEELRFKFSGGCWDNQGFRRVRI
jgi:hypothetical protein